MNEQERVRAEVITRLMMRHGLSGQEADAAWEQFRLHQRAVRLSQDGSRTGVEQN
jgi:hypothetical protein